ncbi:MAG: LLM class flavin-dependent oxidoreductase [Gammaproteobacteria bacterium]
MSTSTHQSTSGNRIGLGLLGAPAVPEMVALAQLAEGCEYESVWVAETRIMRDAMVPCAAIALGTSRLKVATGIVNVYTRGAVLNAVSFVSLEEIAPGRIIMGLGPGSPLVLEPQGYAFDKPVTRLRETIDVIQRLHRGEQVQFVGKAIEVHGAQLEATPPREHIPLYLGVTGPKALELAGEKANGVMLNAFLPASYVERAIERVAAGARRAGRSPSDVDIAGAVVVSVDEDAAAARDRARPFIAMYLSLFPNLARETALADALVERIRNTFREHGQDAAGALVDDDVVDSLTVSGNVEDCRVRLGHYREAGLALPIVFALEPNVEQAIRTLGARAAYHSSPAPM